MTFPSLSRLSFAFASLAMVTVAGACGDVVTTVPTSSGNTGGSPEQGGAGSGVVVGVGGAGGSTNGTGGTPTFQMVKVVVVEGPGQPVPLAGVGLDLKDGGRVDGQTDPSGVASFDGVSLADVTMLIAHKDGYTFAALDATVLNPTSPVVRILPLDLSDGVAISGDFINTDGSEGNTVSVVPTVEGATFFSSDEDANAYSLTVPANTAFTLVALESSDAVINGQTLTASILNAWLRASEGVSQPTTMDVDFDGEYAIATTSLDVSFPAPPDASLAATGVGLVGVIAPSGFGVGGTVSSEIDGADHHVTVEWVPIGGALTTRYLSLVEDGPASLVSTTGGPISDVANIAWVATPYLDTAVAPHALHDEIHWTLSAGGSPDLMFFSVFDADGALGSVAMRPEADGIRVPALPASSNAAAHFDREQVQGALFSCGLQPQQGCTRLARDGIFDIQVAP